MNRSPTYLRTLAFAIAALVACMASAAEAQSQKPKPGQEKAVQVPGGPPVVQLPDLVIDSFEGIAGKGCTPLGYGLKFKVTVRNSGSQPAQLYPGWVMVYVNDANKTWPDPTIGTTMQLASGKSATVESDWVYAKGYQPSPYVGDKGVYYTYHAKVDPANNIKESNESNNNKTYKQHSSSPCALTNR